MIPELLQRSDVSEEDKKQLQFLAQVRKWYPYIVRHSSLTKLANHPKVNEHALRKHAGWSKTSRMVEIYIHRRESVEPVMQALGVQLKNSKEKPIRGVKTENGRPSLSILSYLQHSWDSTLLRVW